MYFLVTWWAFICRGSCHTSLAHGAAKFARPNVHVVEDVPDLFEAVQEVLTDNVRLLMRSASCLMLSHIM